MGGGEGGPTGVLLCARTGQHRISFSPNVPEAEAPGSETLTCPETHTHGQRVSHTGLDRSKRLAHVRECAL